MATPTPKSTRNTPDMPSTSALVTSLKTSSLKEKYVWTIHTGPTLICPESSYTSVRLPDQKFNHGSFSKIDHVCFAAINRKDGRIAVFFDVPASTPGTVVKILHFDLLVFGEGKLVGWKNNSQPFVVNVTKGVSKWKRFCKGFTFGNRCTIKFDSLEVVVHVLFENEPVGTNLSSVLAYGVGAHPLGDSSNMYLEFYNSSFLSDVVILCNDNIIPVHKLLLSRCSPVFFAMFQGENKETIENKVVIDDNFKSVREMLKWMYTGNLEEVDLQTLIDLYKLVHRFQVHALKQTCAKRIYNQIKPETALEIYLLGKVYEDVPLVDMALDTVQRNKSIAFSDPEAYAAYFEKYADFMKTFLTDD